MSETPEHAEPQEGELGSLLAYEGDSIEQILRDLLSDKNVALKTELKNPLAMSKGRFFVSWMKKNGLEGAAEMFKEVLDMYEINMVSYQRKSRTEIVTAVSEIVKRDRKMREKLVENEVR